MRSHFGLLEFVMPRPWGEYGLWRIVRPFSPGFVDTMARRWSSGDADYSPDERLTEWIEQTLEDRRYDLIVGRYLQPTVRSGALCFSPVVVDIDDVDSERVRTELAMPGLAPWRRWVLKRQLSLLRQIEPRWFSRSQRLWVCSEADRSIVGSDRAAILPNIPYVPPGAAPIQPCPPNPASRTVLWVGSLKYLVNERAVDRFLRRVWSRIHRACPDAVFRIVGAGMATAQERRWRRTPGVQPVGFVEDLRAEYGRAAFTVAPLFEGGGTKIKVLESLAQGRTCVLTRHAQRGFEHVLRDGEAFLVCDDDDGLVEGCIRMLQEPAFCLALARTGSERVAEHFSVERFERIVRQTVTDVLSAAGNGVRRNEVQVSGGAARR